MIDADDDHALSILIEATAEVVGTVSKVYQTIVRAVEGGRLDLLAAARAFDGLPAYQRHRIAEIAASHAAERDAAAVGGHRPEPSRPTAEPSEDAWPVESWDIGSSEDAGDGTGPSSRHFG